MLTDKTSAGMLARVGTNLNGSRQQHSAHVTEDDRGRFGHIHFDGNRLFGKCIFQAG